MRIVTYLILCAFALEAHGETLRFQAHIQREDLAEEAIALLHCLAERSGSNWEIGGAPGAHTLELREGPNATLSGLYRNGEKKRTIQLRLGEAEALCEQEYPAPSFELEPQIANPSGEEEELQPKELPWGWIGLSVLGALGGFLLWRASRGADHQVIRMH